LSVDSIQHRGYFDSNLIQNMIRQHQSGFVDYSTELWGLISFEMWARRFLDRQPVVEFDPTNLERLERSAAPASI